HSSRFVRIGQPTFCFQILQENRPAGRQIWQIPSLKFQTFANEIRAFHPFSQSTNFRLALTVGANHSFTDWLHVKVISHREGDFAYKPLRAPVETRFPL